MHRRVKKAAGVGVQVVAVGAEVVVDHVEQHHQAARVRRGHQLLQVVGRP
jgi:hypothetical protein